MDAYTLRKIAPRILIGAIGINLSIYLCVAAIDITNVVGGGLMQLIVAPFEFDKIYVDGSAGNTAGVLTILGGALVGIIVFLGAGGAGGMLAIMLMLVLTVMLLVLAIMITLALRQALLVLLTVLSPIAIALFILPNTEKYFRQWWDLFLKTLMVYPIIAALFAVSGVMASISLSSTGDPSSGDIPGAFQIITGLILVYMPLFMIPFAFKMSGGVLGNVMNAANGVRSNFGNWNKQRLDRAGQNPDSKLARGNRSIRQSALGAQFRAREAIASKNRFRSSAGRAEKLQKLAGMREARNLGYAQEAAQGNYAKATAQVDEAQMDMAAYGSSAASLAAIRKGEHVSFGGEHRDIAKRIDEGKEVSPEERQKLETRQNQLRMFSAMNDKVGRSQATRAAAAKSAAALSYGYGQGEEGWNQAVGFADDIFNGNESQVLNHMNEFQYVAGQVGRSDLSGNVNSREYKAERAAGKVAGAQVMSQSKPSSVEAIIKEQVNTLQGSGSYKDKLRAAKKLADLKAGGNSPYASGANKDVLANYTDTIEGAFSGFANDPRMHAEAEKAARTGASPDEYAENIFAKTSQPSGRTQTTQVGEAEVTQPIPKEMEGAEAATSWFSSQSGKAVDPTEAERAAQGQQQKPEGEQQ